MSVNNLYLLTNYFFVYIYVSVAWIQIKADKSQIVCFGLFYLLLSLLNKVSTTDDIRRDVTLFICGHSGI